MRRECRQHRLVQLCRAVGAQHDVLAETTQVKREAGPRRRYTDEHTVRVTMIIRGKDAGLSLDQLRDTSALRPGRSGTNCYGSITPVSSDGSGTSSRRST